jgi:hypothetical protein
MLRYVVLHTGVEAAIKPFIEQNNLLSSTGLKFDANFCETISESLATGSNVSSKDTTTVTRNLTLVAPNLPSPQLETISSFKPASGL